MTVADPKSFNRPLTRRFVALLGAFLLLQAAQLGIVVFSLLHLGEETEVIAEVQQQRLRTLMLPNLAHEIVHGLVTEGDPEAGHAHQPLAEVAAEYDRAFQRLTREATERNRFEQWYEGERKEQADVLIIEAADVWLRDIKPKLDALAARPHGPGAHAVLVQIERLGGMQFQRLDEAATVYGIDTGSFAHELAGLLGGLLVLSFVLGVVGIVMVRRSMGAPLRQLTEAASAVAGGAYDRRVPVVSQDELGLLADTFNRMAEAVGMRNTRIQSLVDAAGTLTSSLSIAEVLDQSMSRGMAVSGARGSAVMLHDGKTDGFGTPLTLGLSARFMEAVSFRADGIAHEVFRSGVPVMVDDRPQTAHRLSAVAREEGLRAFVCLPLMGHPGCVGVIYFYFDDRDTVPAEEISLLMAFAHLSAIAIGNARTHETTIDLALTDPLTGLHNRRWFDGRLAEELRRSERFEKPLALLLLDIDRFKDINDSHGHPAGDAVIRQVGEIISRQLREVDYAARYGGEEYALALPETDGRVAQHGAERIRRAVHNTPFVLPNGREISVTLSIGIACYPTGATDPISLVAHADQALYIAKQEGRNRVVLYGDMPTVDVEGNPGRIVELLREGMHNIRPIMNVVAAKAPYYRGHTELVEQIVVQLAAVLRLSPVETDRLRLAARLHDIGMSLVPGEILGKTDALGRAEWQTLREHPVEGARLLAQVPELAALAPIVRAHHERYDGSGFPDGLRGEAIPLLARILNVADSYIEMLTGSPGRLPMTRPQAIAALRQGCGTEFDPLVAITLIEILEKKGPDT